MHNRETQYKGVRGWLLLLCVCLTVLDPFSAFMTLIAATNAAKPHFDQYPELFRLVLIGGICSTFLIVFSIYAGLSLWRVVPNAVTTAKRYFISAFIYALFSMFLPVIVGVSEKAFPEFSQGASINNAIVIVYLAIWYLYLMRSKRVKATYGTENLGS
ncbi:MAG TPA: DUF2569 family protein [Syntrophorhabdaceae bacterium]|nr:DUF2569 family protein [Syntrophorhabdaceae bacterium]